MSNVTDSDQGYALDLRAQKISVLVSEHRYVGERLQAGTMTMEEARAWLKAHGHDGDAP